MKSELKNLELTVTVRNKKPHILHIEMLCSNFIIVETKYNIFKDLCLSHYNRNQHPLIYPVLRTLLSIAANLSK